MTYKEMILLKCGEIALKGLNRRSFEDALMRNCRHALSHLGSFRITSAQSTVYVEALDDDIFIDDVEERLKKVFGIAALTRAAVLPKDFEAVAAAAPGYLERYLSGAKSFKVEAKRSDKSFPMKSPQLCAELGGVLLDAFPALHVDVHKPEVTVYVEIRERHAFLHIQQQPGAGGMPVGTSGRAMLLISGGIDSPVAGYRMARRGLQIQAIHFVSPPYTSGHALEKVKTLCREIAPYTGAVRLYVVPFTEFQLAIRDNCPEMYFTVIMRRCMMRIAQRAARANGCDALITGESLAQVASQTLGAIACTNEVASMPVLRPLIGMDKSEIVSTATAIGTFETSILPYEDCCTVFTPKHPKTSPRLEAIIEAEKALDIDGLAERAYNGIEVEMLR